MKVYKCTSRTGTYQGTHGHKVVSLTPISNFVGIHCDVWYGLYQEFHKNISKMREDRTVVEFTNIMIITICL